jgi:hypothetical protein
MPYSNWTSLAVCSGQRVSYMIGLHHFGLLGIAQKHSNWAASLQAAKHGITTASHTKPLPDLIL